MMVGHPGTDLQLVGLAHIYIFIILYLFYSMVFYFIVLYYRLLYLILHMILFSFVIMVYFYYICL
jgi:hypothetical protein